MPEPDFDPLFDRALSVVLAHEGGFADNRNDPGGATNFGISLRWLKEIGMSDIDADGSPDGDINLDGHIDIDDIRLLTRETAGAFYRRFWWDKFGYGELHLSVGTKVFDLAVNMGAQQAHKVLQRACRACGPRLLDDGILGPKSREAISAIPPADLVIAMRSEAAGFYRALVMARPGLSSFLTGWLNRAYA